MLSGEIPEWAKRLKAHWVLLSQLGAWVVAILGGFWLPPPSGFSHNHEGDANTRFASFFVSLFIGLMAIPLLRWNKPQHTQRWFFAGVVSLLLCLVAFLAYSYLHSMWVFDYHNVPVLAGGTLKNNAKIRLEMYPDLSHEELLWQFIGKVEDVWTPESIQTRRMVLSTFYILGLPLFVGCLISVLQTYHCASQEKAAYSSSPPPPPEKPHNP